ncbi:MAG: hypothetical protein RRB13_14440 [bacterium]|nr:hypothetical protein [bacterium]
MIEKTLKKISAQLELFAKNGISILRALDILEASTQDVEEIICLNTLRESLVEVASSDKKKTSKSLVNFAKPRHEGLQAVGMA